MSADSVVFDPSVWVGRAQRTTVRAVAETVQMLEASLDRPAPSPNASVPPLRHWLWLFAPPAPPTRTLGPDGHPPRGELIPDWPLPRRMWASSAVDFVEPVPLDTVLERVSTLVSATIKPGRSGRLGFVVIRHEWRLPDGRLAIDDHQTVVYREAAPAAPAAEPPAPPPASAKASVPPMPGAWEVTHAPDPVLLFRYSALSFNAHRIHYDLPYASGTEGYPGLVVHGPLMATLMLDAFRDAHPECRVRRFEFRALAPAFAGAPLHCGGTAEGPGRARLWVRDPAGREHLSGSVSFD